MHRSSESIGTIAAALAKAQLELNNPEKSLTATIHSPFPRESDRTFRYASLASGLEIVRKALGKHEIATVQTTALDKEASLIKLTTVLAHSSGEWISSEWPVCPVTETAAPHRLGAALTYARRYALFTLVGITGEDDMDAPDLQDASTPKRQSDAASAALGMSSAVSRTRANRQPAIVALPLSHAESAELGDALLTEVDGLSSLDDATSWSKRRLPDKNKLVNGDAQAVEIAFEKKLRLLGGEHSLSADLHQIDSEKPCAGDAATVPGAPASEVARRPPRSSQPRNVKIARLRDKEHLKYVARQPCVLCGRSPSDAHHLRFAQPRALGRKVSDEFTVPVCRLHHREVHRHGNELVWWASMGIEPLSVARKLWEQTHPALAGDAVHGRASRPPLL